MAILAQRIRKLSGDVPAVIRARPALTFGVLSVLLAAGLAARKTRSFPRRQTLWHRLRHGRRQVKAALDLPPLAIKLLANPLVGGYLRRTVLRTVSRKLGR
jgi:hypothetical protein